MFLRLVEFGLDCYRGKKCILLFSQGTVPGVHSLGGVTGPTPRAEDGRRAAVDEPCHSRDIVPWPHVVLVHYRYKLKHICIKRHARRLFVYIYSQARYQFSVCHVIILEHTTTSMFRLRKYNLQITPQLTKKDSREKY